MYIAGSFTKCKSEIPILIHVFPIVLNEKVLLIFLAISTNKNYHGIEKNQRFFWYNFHVKIIPERR